MKMDRNINTDGQGKYALLRLRTLDQYRPDSIMDDSPVFDAITLLETEGILDWGNVGTESEFFVIRLKDRNARAALTAYADSIRPRDSEFAGQVDTMAARSGELSPFCKDPD